MGGAITVSAGPDVETPRGDTIPMAWHAIGTQDLGDELITMCGQRFDTKGGDALIGDPHKVPVTCDRCKAAVRDLMAIALKE